MINHLNHYFKNQFCRAVLSVAICILLMGHASAENLRHVFEATNVQNPDLLSARLQVLSEIETIQQAYGAVHPQLHIALNGALHSLTEENKEAANRYNSNAYGSASAALVWNQPLYSGGALWAGIDVARAGVQAALQDLRTAEQDIFMQALTAYVDYNTARATRDFRNDNVERLTQHLRATEQSFALGRANRTDVALAMSRHASAVADRDDAEATYDEAVFEYARIVGETPPENKALPPFPDDSGIADDVESLLNLALDNHPLMKAASLRVHQAKRTIRLRLAEHFPQVSASASIQHDDSDAPLRPDNEQSFVLRGQVTIPLYSGGTTSSKVREARYAHRRQQQKFNATRRQIAKTANSAWTRYSAAITQQEARQAAVDSAELALQGMTSAYDLGSGSFLDLLDSEQNYTEATIANATAEGNLFLALFRVQAAMGNLTTAGLQLQDPMEEVAVAISEDKNLRRAARKADKDGSLELQQSETLQ